MDEPMHCDAAVESESHPAASGDGEIRQAQDAGLHAFDANADGVTATAGSADGSEASDKVLRREPPNNATETSSPPTLTSRLSSILAAAEGCLKPSGEGPAVKIVTVGLACDIVKTTETFFSDRGEKWLRANCGGLLAKDESFGFLCTDVVHGKLAERFDAIKLGEKLRKENAKVKKIEKDEKVRISKVPAGQPREAARRQFELDLAARLAQPCSELPIPSAERCAAVKREAVKREAKQANPPAPAPTAIEAPEPKEGSIQDYERRVAEGKSAVAAARAEHEAVKAAGVELLCDMRRLSKAQERAGEPKVPKELLQVEGDYEKEVALIGVRRDWENEWKTYEETSQQIIDWTRDMEVLERDELDAANALQAAKIELECDMRCLAVVQEMEPERQQMIAPLEAATRAQTRARIELDSILTWGPDHASRPPAAFYDVRGDLQPGSAAVQLADGSWVGSRAPTVPSPPCSPPADDAPGPPQPPPPPESPPTPKTPPVRPSWCKVLVDPEYTQGYAESTTGVWWETAQDCPCPACTKPPSPTPPPTQPR